MEFDFKKYFLDRIAWNSAITKKDLDRIHFLLNEFEKTAGVAWVNYMLEFEISHFYGFWFGMENSLYTYRLAWFEILLKKSK